MGSSLLGLSEQGLVRHASTCLATRPDWQRRHITHLAVDEVLDFLKLPVSGLLLPLICGRFPVGFFLQRFLLELLDLLVLLLDLVMFPLLLRFLLPGNLGLESHEFFLDARLLLLVGSLDLIDPNLVGFLDSPEFLCSLSVLISQLNDGFCGFLGGLRSFHAEGDRVIRDLLCLLLDDILSLSDSSCLDLVGHLFSSR